MYRTADKLFYFSPSLNLTQNYEIVFFIINYSKIFYIVTVCFVCQYAYVYMRNMTLEKFISVLVLHFLQWLRLTTCFIFIDTPWSSDLSHWIFFSVITVFKSVISVTKVRVCTYIRSVSAWHMSMHILLRETSLSLPFPTFPPGIRDPNPLC